MNNNFSVPKNKTKSATIQYASHDLQAEVHRDPSRFKVLACGRRWGKSLFGCYELYKSLVFSKDKSPRGWIVAPTYPMAREDWRILWEMFAPIIVDQNVNDMRMTLVATVEAGAPRYAEIELKSSDRADETLRGAGLNAVLLDECSRIPKDAWEYGIRPALADKEGTAVFISTPRGMNWYYDIFRLGQDGKDSDWKSWQFPSITNPHFPRAEWEKLEKVTPKDIWRQEFLAEFLEQGACIFHGLDDCTGGVLSYAPETERYYAIGTDLARSNDFTVLVGMDDTGQVCYVHRSREMDWALQRGLIEGASKTWNQGQVILDSSGPGDVIEQDMRRMGVPLQGVRTNSPLVKTELIEYLIVAIENRWIRIPSQKDHPQLAWLWDELRAFQREPTAQGNYRYQAPEGKHDDGVIALALAAWGQKGRLGQARVFPGHTPHYTTWGEYHSYGFNKQRRIGNIIAHPTIYVRPW